MRLPWWHLRKENICAVLVAIDYTSLEQLCNADPEDYFRRQPAYYEQHGKGKPFDATPKTAQGLIDIPPRAFVPRAVGQGGRSREKQAGL